MIVAFDELKLYRKKVVMVDGGFDPLHHGHVEYFRQAAELGLPVLCNIAPDSYVRIKHEPLLPLRERARVIDSLRYIDFTHPNQLDTEAVLRELQPRYYVKGKDWAHKLPTSQREICAQYDIEIVYLDSVRDSSSRLLTTYFDHKNRHEEATMHFEKHVQSQAIVPASDYDGDYFLGEWRKDNNYTVEARRRIEAKNPELIASVFRPVRVLDVGCGPGALMYLLREQGLDVYGVDASASSRQLAPPEVRERIQIADACALPYEDNSYDLVICREVFEHLRILDIQRAVQEICRVTSRYVYVTTRFHPHPVGLLDVTDERHVDPSHITLLNKEFLRVLFIMQGMRSRPDLESQMDWLKKGRVLVYEKNKRCDLN